MAPRIKGNKRERLECQDCGGNDILLVADLCHVDECEGEQFSKNLCKKHYQRAWRLLKDAKEKDGFWEQVDLFTQDRRYA